jgi:hypothetical protein
MSGAGADTFPFSLQGADWWIMNLDGSSKQVGLVGYIVRVQLRTECIERFSTQ